MTFKEYRLHMKAKQLQEVDDVYHLHLQAFQNMRVKAQKKAGKNKTKPVYDKFDKFFDYEDAVRKVMDGEKSPKQNLMQRVGTKLKEIMNRNG